MKSNYVEYMAWFQHTIQPNIITRHEEDTRCQDATSKKPLVSFDSMTNHGEQGTH